MCLISELMDSHHPKHNVQIKIVKHDHSCNQGGHPCLVVQKLLRERLLKQVFCPLLKHERVEAVRIYSGKSFQSFGVSYEKYTY